MKIIIFDIKISYKIKQFASQLTDQNINDGNLLYIPIN